MSETAPVTIVSCLYGNGYEKFIPQWADSIAALTTRPEKIIVGTDMDAFARGTHIPYAQVVVSQPDWRHPQAFHLQQAIEAATTEWVWILDIDDTALPDALDGIENVTADVWQMGYITAEGEEYVVPQMTGDEYLQHGGNPFVGTSAIRTEAFRRCGGFPDVAFQDFALWRRLAFLGASFESSGRVHSRYSRHDDARTVLELVPDLRDDHMAEMLESETVAQH